MQRIFITGCSGYLAQRLIDACRADPTVEWLGGIDVRPPQNPDSLHYFQVDVRSPEVGALLKEHGVTTVVHLAWVFNPTHDPQREYEVDVNGSRNIFESVKKAGVPYLIYLSSTTAYGPHPDNPQIFDESYPRRGHRGYLYSKYKAEVDQMAAQFIAENAQVHMLMIRAPIILGPHTQNIVTRMIDLPILFGVRGYDPPMQFLHEDDLQRLLIWCVQKQPVGVFNVSGQGTIRYSEIVRHMKKPSVRLPALLLYPALELLWKARIMPFPSSILDFIRYPWVASSEKFHASCDFSIQHTSEEAFLAYARVHGP